MVKRLIALFLSFGLCLTSFASVSVSADPGAAEIYQYAFKETFDNYTGGLPSGWTDVRGNIAVGSEIREVTAQVTNPATATSGTYLRADEKTATTDSLDLRMDVTSPSTADAVLTMRFRPHNMTCIMPIFYVGFSDDKEQAYKYREYSTSNGLTSNGYRLIAVGGDGSSAIAGILGADGSRNTALKVIEDNNWYDVTLVSKKNGDAKRLEYYINGEYQGYREDLGIDKDATISNIRIYSNKVTSSYHARVVDFDDIFLYNSRPLTVKKFEFDSADRIITFSAPVTLSEAQSAISASDGSSITVANADIGMTKFVVSGSWTADATINVASTIKDVLGNTLDGQSSFPVDSLYEEGVDSTILNARAFLENTSLHANYPASLITYLTYLFDKFEADETAVANEIKAVYNDLANRTINASNSADANDIDASALAEISRPLQGYTDIQCELPLSASVIARDNSTVISGASVNWSIIDCDDNTLDAAISDGKLVLKNKSASGTPASGVKYVTMLANVEGTSVSVLHKIEITDANWLVPTGAVADSNGIVTASGIVIDDGTSFINDISLKVTTPSGAESTPSVYVLPSTGTTVTADSNNKITFKIDMAANGFTEVGKYTYTFTASDAYNLKGEFVYGLNIPQYAFKETFDNYTGGVPSKWTVTNDGGRTFAVGNDSELGNYMKVTDSAATSKMYITSSSAAANVENSYDQIFGVRFRLNSGDTDERFLKLVFNSGYAQQFAWRSCAADQGQASGGLRIIAAGPPDSSEIKQISKDGAPNTNLKIVSPGTWYDIVFVLRTEGSKRIVEYYVNGEYQGYRDNLSIGLDDTIKNVVLPADNSDGEQDMDFDSMFLYNSRPLQVSAVEFESYGAAPQIITFSAPVSLADAQAAIYASDGSAVTVTNADIGMTKFKVTPASGSWGAGVTLNVAVTIKDILGNTLTGQTSFAPGQLYEDGVDAQILTARAFLANTTVHASYPVSLIEYLKYLVNKYGAGDESVLAEVTEINGDLANRTINGDTASANDIDLSALTQIVRPPLGNTEVEGVLPLNADVKDRSAGSMNPQPVIKWSIVSIEDDSLEAIVTDGKLILKNKAGATPSLASPLYLTLKAEIEGTTVRVIKEIEITSKNWLIPTEIIPENYEVFTLSGKVILKDSAVPLANEIGLEVYTPVSKAPFTINEFIIPDPASGKTTVVPDANGEFTFKFNMAAAVNNATEPGDYVFKFVEASSESSEGKFNFVSSTDRANIVDSVENVTALTTIQDLFEDPSKQTNRDILQIDTSAGSVYDSLSSKANLYAELTNRNYGDNLETARASIEEAIMFAALEEKDVSDYADFLENNSTFFAVTNDRVDPSNPASEIDTTDYAALYNLHSAEAIAILKKYPDYCKALKSATSTEKAYDKEAFAEFFKRTLIMCDLNSVNELQIATRFQTHLPKLLACGLYASYNTGNSSHINAIKVLYDVQYEVLDSYISAVNTAINAPVYNTGSTTTSPTYTYTGGGGGGGSYTPSTPTTPTAPASNEFTDVPSGFWGYAHINRLASLGIINGKGNGIFDPDGNIKREEYLKMIILALGLKPNGEVSAFSDVQPGQWYYEYVALAEKLGIVKGMEDGKFGVGTNISRQDAATLMYRCLIEIKGMDTKDVSLDFADNDSIAPYAKDGVAYLADLGIINGVGENTFAPGASMTRAMVAKMIDIMMQLK